MAADPIAALRVACHRKWSVEKTRGARGSGWQWEPQWGAPVCVRAAECPIRVLEGPRKRPKILVMLDGPRRACRWQLPRRSSAPGWWACVERAPSPRTWGVVVNVRGVRSNTSMLTRSYTAAPHTRRTCIGVYKRPRPANVYYNPAADSLCRPGSVISGRSWPSPSMDLSIPRARMMTSARSAVASAGRIPSRF